MKIKFFCILILMLYLCQNAIFPNSDIPLSSDYNLFLNNFRNVYINTVISRLRSQSIIDEHDQVKLGALNKQQLNNDEIFFYTSTELYNYLLKISQTNSFVSPGFMSHIVFSEPDTSQFIKDIWTQLNQPTNNVPIFFVPAHYMPLKGILKNVLLHPYDQNAADFNLIDTFYPLITSGFLTYPLWHPLFNGNLFNDCFSSLIALSLTSLPIVSTSVLGSDPQYTFQKYPFANMNGLLMPNGTDIVNIIETFVILDQQQNFKFNTIFHTYVANRWSLNLESSSAIYKGSVLYTIAQNPFIFVRTGFGMQFDTHKNSSDLFTQYELQTMQNKFQLAVKYTNSTKTDDLTSALIKVGYHINQFEVFVGYINEKHFNEISSGPILGFGVWF